MPKNASTDIQELTLDLRNYRCYVRRNPGAMSV